MSEIKDVEKLVDNTSNCFMNVHREANWVSLTALTNSKIFNFCNSSKSQLEFWKLASFSIWMFFSKYKVLIPCPDLSHGQLFQSLMEDATFFRGSLNQSLHLPARLKPSQEHVYFFSHLSPTLLPSWSGEVHRMYPLRGIFCLFRIYPLVELSYPSLSSPFEQGYELTFALQLASH